MCLRKPQTLSREFNMSLSTEDKLTYQKAILH